VPSAWSQVAVDVLAQKYFRKAGIPAALVALDEPGVPAWLQRRRVDKAALERLPEAERHGGETSAKQVFDRLAGTWTYWGWKGGYFDSEEDAHAFFDELRFMLAMQMAAPNSPQWFNTGLYWAYGIDGPSQGHYYVDYKTGQVHASQSAYEHPQPHACFIQSVQDDLVNEGGIMDLWVREARLFKYGSGTGSNFSRLRGENERLVPRGQIPSNEQFLDARSQGHPAPNSTIGDQIYVKLLNQAFRPSLLPNRVETDSLRRAIRQSVDSVKDRVRANELVVGEHQVVTDDVHARLDALRTELIQRGIGGRNWTNVLGQFLASILVLSIFWLLLLLYRRESYVNLRHIAVFTVLFGIVILGAALNSRFVHAGAELIPIPFALAKLQAAFLQYLPKPLLTPDQVEMLKRDNVVSAEAQADRRTLEGLGIAPTAMEVIVPSYLWRFRKTGQFKAGRFA